MNAFRSIHLPHRKTNKVPTCNQLKITHSAIHLLGSQMENTVFTIKRENQQSKI